MATEVEKLRLKQEQLAAQLKAEFNKQKTRPEGRDPTQGAAWSPDTASDGDGCGFKAVIDRYLLPFLPRKVDRAVFDSASSDTSLELRGFLRRRPSGHCQAIRRAPIDAELERALRPVDLISLP